MSAAPEIDVVRDCSMRYVASPDRRFDMVGDTSWAGIAHAVIEGGQAGKRASTS